MANVKKTVKKAQKGIKATADNTSVKKPETSKVPGTKYKYIDRWTPSGKTPSSTDSADYKKGYNIGVRGRRPGLFDPLFTQTGAEEGLENSKKYEKKKSGGEVTKAKAGKQMIKRADGSTSQRGLWDNIRAAKGSGKKPTAQMLKQEKKIKAASKKK